MGQTTAIAWTDHTFNPWWGCTKVSEGCRNCYAETWAKRMGWNVWGAKKRRPMGDDYWKQPLKWNKEAQAEGVTRRVFCASMADVFEDDPALNKHRARLWGLIEQTPHLEWLLLTKRPQKIDCMIPALWVDNYPENVRFGTTVEDMEVIHRVEIIREFPRNFLSVEPMIGPVTFYPGGIDWVIIGGESGPNCRPMAIEWARDLAQECIEANIPVFMKQLGGHPDKRDRLEDWPEDLRLREFPEVR